MTRSGSRTGRWAASPVWWTASGPIPDLQWKRGGAGADAVAALMVAVVLLHRADYETGRVKVSYDELEVATGRPRALVSRGLALLRELDLVLPGGKRSEYIVRRAAPDVPEGVSSPWGKMPCSSMYVGQAVGLFTPMSLRARSELDALKLFFYLVASRDRKRNLVQRSYRQIAIEAGVPLSAIKRALSHLINGELIQVEKRSDPARGYQIQFYRVTGIGQTIHSGNTSGDELL